jgi:hypothetical protein
MPDGRLQVACIDPNNNFWAHTIGLHSTQQVCNPRAQISPIVKEKKQRDGALLPLCMTHRSGYNSGVSFS